MFEIVQYLFDRCRFVAPMEEFETQLLAGMFPPRQQAQRDLLDGGGIVDVRCPRHASLSAASALSGRSASLVSGISAARIWVST